MRRGSSGVGEIQGPGWAVGQWPSAFHTWRLCSAGTGSVWNEEKGIFNCLKKNTSKFAQFTLIHYFQ